MQLHILFVGNVAAHWVALMSGIASVIVATYENIRNKPILARWFWVVALVCLAAACDGAWQDEHRNTETVKAEKSAQAGLANSCINDARVEHAYMEGLQGLNASQRQTIDKQQQANDVQQRDVASCVVSLGKMNPKVREEIVVVPISLFTMDKTGKLVSKIGLLKVYVSLLVITTNEVQPRFHGTLRCENPFTALNAPQLPDTSQTVMKVTATPNRISDREYEISATVAGTEWAPAHPAYMTVSTDSETTGKCSFVPLE
jgi:hypothetical protein